MLLTSNIMPTFAATPNRVVEHSDWKYAEKYCSNYIVTYKYKLSYITPSGEWRLYKIGARVDSFDYGDWYVTKVTSSPKVNEKIGTKLKMTAHLKNDKRNLTRDEDININTLNS